MRTRGLERSAGPRGGGRGEGRTVQAPGSRRGCTPDPRGPAISGEAQPGGALSAAARLPRLPLPGSTLSAQETLLKGAAPRTRATVPGHAKSLKGFIAKRRSTVCDPLFRVCHSSSQLRSLNLRSVTLSCGLQILDEVEKRREISPALVQPLMRSVMEAPFPALGKTITVKTFLPGSGTEVIELCRPMDSRLEHVDFESLFSSLSVRHLVSVFASLLLERRVIFIADKLSTLSKCCHAMVALIYPFSWQHTYIPVLPPAMIDIVCSPTPFLIGLLSSSLPLLRELPLEEVLVVDLINDRFLRQMEDEDSILPRKLQVALEHILEQRNDLAYDQDGGPLDCVHGPESSPLNEVVSEAFVRFFVEIVGHYSLFLTSGEERSLQREAFRKAVSSKSLRRFLEVFMETQTFRGFMQERELRRQDVKGLFEVRAQEYLETLPSGEHSGVNKFLKGLGNKMKFLHKK
ncbi:DENN domain-containing protein 2A [Psammomys obesus]|uniref:DENN domain-containing protein 2A n=1 Tax=Psammomys obesus TaxID=48139 RepID=UPI0024533971|nr:DENN domain-containing protein 2A [Psammomys obesus]